MIHRIAILPLLAAVLAACASAGTRAPGESTAAQQPAERRGRHPARFEVVGRGPVLHTRSTDLWAFRGVDGRDYVYTATSGVCDGCIGNRLYAWDVSDPARPALTDSVVVDAKAIMDVAVNEAGTLAAFGRRGAESLRNGVVLLDLADPAHPRPVGEYWETLTGGVQAVYFSGDHLFLVDAGTGEMRVLDVGNPRAPRLLGRWGVPRTGSQFLSDLVVRDGLAYLAYWNDGLVILDVGNGVRGGTPQEPRLVSQVRYRTEWRRQRVGRTHAVYPYTNRAGRRYVFVADRIVPPGADLNRRQEIGGLLHVFDAADVAKPELVANYEVTGYGVNRFWVHGDTLYAGTNNGGLRALDVSGNLRGRIGRRELAVLPTGDPRGFIPNLTFTWAAMTHNGLVFATDLNTGLWITRLVPGGR
jgi:hypothetical protein